MDGELEHPYVEIVVGTPTECRRLRHREGSEAQSYPGDAHRSETPCQDIMARDEAVARLRPNPRGCTRQEARIFLCVDRET